MNPDRRELDPEALAHAIHIAQGFLEALMGVPVEDAEGRVVLTRTLRPQDDDWASLFHHDVREAYRSWYEAGLWSDPRHLRFARAVDQTTFRFTGAAPGWAFAASNPLSSRLPGGYRRIAQHLQPMPIWMAWSFVSPSRLHPRDSVGSGGARDLLKRAPSGMAYNGLVALPDGRLVWCPKPWRAPFAAPS